MARVWLVLHIAPRCLKTAAMPKMHVFMHFTICRFHRSFFLTEFRTFSGLFFPKRLAVTITKKRKICYKPFDFFLSKFESKKLGGAYQRPQGGGRGGGGRWSGWWRKVVKWRTWSKMERTFVCFAKQNTHQKLVFSFCGAKARKPWMSIWHH